MTAAEPTLDSAALAERIAEIASDKKAIDIRVIDLRGIVSYTDFFVICSGNTERQAKAIHDGIYEELKKGGAITRPASASCPAAPRATARRAGSSWTTGTWSYTSSRPRHGSTTGSKTSGAKPRPAASANHFPSGPLVEHARYDLGLRVSSGRIFRGPVQVGGLYDDGAIIKVQLQGSLVVAAGGLRAAAATPPTRSTWWPSTATRWTGATCCPSLSSLGAEPSTSGSSRPRMASGHVSTLR